MGFEKVNPPRRLSDPERQLLDALTALTGLDIRELLRGQIETSAVDGEYAEGDPTFTLAVNRERTDRIPDVGHVLVEATGTDVDNGGEVEIILFADDDGYVRELQCYRLDDVIVRSIPDSSALRPKV